MEKPKRAPAVERRIDGISEEDIRVRVVGEIVKSDNATLIKDETSKIKIDTETPLKKGKVVRVFGRPVKTQDGLEISSEFTQDMSELNRNLYKTIYALDKGDTNG
ncbi:MAG: hypothetical protein R6U26_02425 [Candidatus Undinarchaeales archaeon]